MFRTMCTTESYSQKLKFQNALTCPVNTVASNNVPRRKRQRQTKEPRQKRTGNHHGTKTTRIQQTNRPDNSSTQGPRPSIHNLSEQSLVKLKRKKVQRPSTRANWIPGISCHSKSPNSLAQCRFTTGQKQKFLSRTACVMQKRSKFKFHMSIRHSGSPSWFSPSSDCN